MDSFLFVISLGSRSSPCLRRVLIRALNDVGREFGSFDLLYGLNVEITHGNNTN